MVVDAAGIDDHCTSLSETLPTFKKGDRVFDELRRGRSFKFSHELVLNRFNQSQILS